MTDRGAGGTTTGGDDVDLDELRRTDPRRAARMEEEHRRGELFDQDADTAPPAEPVPEEAHAEPVVDGQYVDGADDGPHDEGPHGGGDYAGGDYAEDGYAEGGYAEDGYAQDGYVESGHAEAGYADGGHGGPVVDDGYYHDPDPDPFADPDTHEVFGNPVTEGYVPVVDRPGGRRRRPRWVGLLTLLVVVGLVGAAGWFAWQAVRPVVADLAGFELFDAPEDYAGAGTGSVEVVVAQGDSGAQIGRTLVDAGVVASVEAFLAAANANPEFTRVQPGTYTVPQQLPAVDAVTALLDPANRVNDTVVIAEGLRVDQILDRLSEGTGIPREELQAALDAAELPAGAREVPGLINPAEGFLYPDGYQFGQDPTAEQVISTMIARGQEVLAEAGVAPEDQLEVLTKASLVQGEARLDEDFGKVAQVVENRLAINQPLGLDSTVNYATQTFDTRTTAEQRASDSPYNTYVVAGLPPGPIKSPGRQAIQAVVEPTPGPWLYFVTVNLCTGETAFAETYEEHLDNVDVLNAWQRENTDDDGNLICG